MPLIQSKKNRNSIVKINKYQLPTYIHIMRQFSYKQTKTAKRISFFDCCYCMEHLKFRKKMQVSYKVHRIQTKKSERERE